MKKVLLVLALFLVPASALAQCAGIFGANQVCGSVAGGPPTATSVGSMITLSLASPPPIGNTTPNTVASSDLSVFGTGEALQFGIPSGARTTIINGTTTAPVTALNAPTVVISRVEALPSTGGPQSSALYVFSDGTAASNSQNQAVTAFAQNSGSADTVAVMGVAQQNVATHFAYGAYFQATAATAINAFAIGNEIRADNSTGADQSYSLNAVPGITGVHILTLGANKAAAGLWVGQIGGTTTFDVGLLFSPSSITTASIQDDSSSATILRATGTHTTGIDLSGATITTPYKSSAFSVDGSGNIQANSIMLGSSLVELSHAGGENIYLGGQNTISRNLSTGAVTLATNASNLVLSPAGVTTTAQQITSTLATGTAPFVVASTTLVANLHAAQADVLTAGSNIPVVTLAWSATAPTIASGFCSTGTATTISASNGTAAFDILIGAATCGSTGTLTLPAATTGWVCNATDVTTPASHNVVQTGTQGSTTTVVLTDYARTTGIAQNFNPSDHIHVQCTGF